MAYDSAFLYHSRLAWSYVSSTTLSYLTDLSFDSSEPNVWGDFLEYVFKPVYEGGLTATDEQVAVLFIVISISMLLDHSLPPFHPDATQYYHLSRISITLGEVGDLPYWVVAVLTSQ